MTTIEKKTYAEVLTQVLALHEKLAKSHALTERVDERTVNMQGDIAEVKEQVFLINGRVAQSQRAIARIYGIGAGIIAFAGLLSIILKLCGVY